MAHGGKQFQYGLHWRPSDSVKFDTLEGGRRRQTSGVVNRPLYMKHARIDFKERQMSSLTLREARNPGSNDQRASVSKGDVLLLDDLTQYRKLLLKRQLSLEENMNLIKTIQKVKQMSFSVKDKRKVKDSESIRDDIKSPLKNNGGDVHMKPSSSHKREQWRQLSARMRSNESVLDSFRVDFLQGIQSNSMKSIDLPVDKEYVPVSNSSIPIEGSTDSSLQMVQTGNTDSEDGRNRYGQTSPKCTDDQNTTASFSINQKVVIRSKLRRWHSDSSIVIQGCVDETTLKDKNQNFVRVWSYSVDSLRNVRSSENPESSSSHHITGNSNHSSQHALLRGVSSEGCRTLDRRPERERRIRTEPPPPRLDARGLFGEDFPPVDMSLTRNGFRPGSRHPYFQKTEHPLVTTSYRYGNPKEFGAPLASITGTAGGTTTLQGYRVGISSREKLSRPVPQRTGRIRNGTGYPGGTERKGYQYTDAVPGACQAFQQRLIEIANLEGDTIRYERMRKVKKKAKQDK